MLERRTFIVRIHAHPQLPIVEDAATGECVQLPDLGAIPGELRRRLDPTTDNPPMAEADPSERP